MIMKNKSYDTQATEEGFRTHLKKRALIMIAMVISGIAILIWINSANWNSPLAGAHERDYTLGLFGGYSVAVIVSGSLRLVRTIRCMRNPEKFQKAYTEYTDERNRFVYMKSYYYSAYIFIVLLALSIVVGSFVGMPPVISSTLAACIGVFALILTITYRIMNKRY